MNDTARTDDTPDASRDEKAPDREANTNASSNGEPGFSDVFEMIANVARRSAGPLALVWLTVTAAEYLLTRRLLSTILVDGDLLDAGARIEYVSLQADSTVIGLGIAGLIGLAAFKLGLYRPLRDIVLDGESPSVSAIVSSALERVGAVLRVQIVVVLALFATLVVASMVGSQFPLFVVLPLAFTLAPATYFAAAREMGALEALGTTLDVVRRHWMAIFAVHGIGVWLSLLGSGSSITPAWLASGTMQSTFSTLRALSTHLLTSYLGWLGVAGAYLAIDKREAARREA